MQVDEQNKKILLIEDDEILCLSVKKYLFNKGYDLQFIYDGVEISKLLQESHFDLIILDIILPHKDGIFWLKWLKQYYPHIPIIMASVKTNEEERLHGLENGAQDYLVKPFKNKELLIRIENVLSNTRIDRSKQFIKIGWMTFDIKAHAIIKNKVATKLTTLEAKILKLLYINEGYAVSRKDIAEQVQGIIFNPLDRSVDIHIRNLRKKIEDTPSKPSYIQTEHGKGYRLVLVA